ncbi:MAG: hypothetical protein WD995_07920 [Gemmatimonadota bacterium]
MHRTRLLLLSTATLFTLGCGSDAPSSEADQEAQAGSAPTFPLDPDIWTAELLTGPEGALSVGPPTQAIHRQGYDNQPYFTPDGAGFWFTALDEHTQQTDIWLYDLAGSVEQVTVSAPESEYSATPMPGAPAVSVVRVETDSTQRLWRVPLDGSAARVILPDVAPVGYHAWIDAGRVALFVLGEPPTLRVADIETGTVRVVAEGIGRSIRSIPGESAVSFVQIAEDGTATLMRYDGADASVTALVETIGNGEFHAWTPGGTVLMARDALIFAWTPGSDGWTQIGDLTEHRVRITRLAVSPDGSQIAIVVEPGDVTL